MSSLVIQDLHVAIGEKKIVKGLSLTINSGEVHEIGRASCRERVCVPV